MVRHHRHRSPSRLSMARIKSHTCPTRFVAAFDPETCSLLMPYQQLGLHRISNPDPDDFAISLHRKFTLFPVVSSLESWTQGLSDTYSCTVYTPPNAAIHGFCLYDEKSGKAMHIKQTNYYSVRGKRLDDGIE